MVIDAFVQHRPFETEDWINVTLGPRVVKTGIAVTLALYICSLLNLEPPVFAGVAAIFTIQPSIYRTWKQVLDQVQTNTLGAIIAIIALFTLGNDPIIVGLIMIIVILISLKLKMEDTIGLTLVTVLAIMSAPGNEDIQFALHRFGIILIGMASAFLVNLLISPPKYKKHFIENVQSIFQNMSILMRTAISNELTEKSIQEQMEQLEKDIKKLEEQYKLSDEEREKLSKVKTVDPRQIVVFKQMLKSLQQGFDVLENVEDHYFQSKSNTEENLLFDYHLEQLIKYHEIILLKYEGKIKVDEPSLEIDLIQQTGQFLEVVMDAYNKEDSEKIILVVVASSIYKYAVQIDRLNRVIDLYTKKN